ncbi:MAG: hypothetical protein R3F21_07230 [Myxococcota bacterium]
MSFRQGDRVRIRNLQSEYTGCRGTIVDPDAPGTVALGRLVAIDGENGIARPFLVGDLEILRAARVAPRAERTLQSEADSE